MEALIKLIFFVVMFVGVAIVKALNKGQGNSDSEEVALEARLEEAIRRAKDQVEGRKAGSVTPPQVRQVLQQGQMGSSSGTVAPPSRREVTASSQQPVTVPYKSRIPEQSRSLPVTAAPVKVVTQSAPVPPLPHPTPAAAYGEEAVVLARKAAAAQPMADLEPKTEAGKHLKRFEKLMSMNAYEMPAETKRREVRASRRQERARKPSRNEMRRMVVYAELLMPPASRRRHIGATSPTSAR